MIRDRKLIGLLALITALVILASGCAKSQTGQEQPKSLNDANLKTVVLTVEGIT